MIKEPTTPEKKLSKSNNKLPLQDILSGQLMSPYSCSLLTAPSGVPKSSRKQPQYLLSPSPVKKDLFAQLLGTEYKHSNLIFSSNSIIEQELTSNDDILSSYEDDESEIVELLSEDDEANESDDNLIKKRKRKSTAQIKMLKQELNEEENWNKDTIVRMAKITGLSQSQVYKWFWDQKKKTRVNDQKNQTIKKRLTFQDFNNVKQIQNYQAQAHQKGSWEDKNTVKKLNKRLIFS